VAALVVMALPDTDDLPLFAGEKAPRKPERFQNSSEPQAATLVGSTCRSLLELVIGIARGFIASNLAYEVDMQQPVLSVFLRGSSACSTQFGIEISASTSSFVRRSMIHPHAYTAGSR
jgi:hypothetical protein